MTKTSMPKKMSWPSGRQLQLPVAPRGRNLPWESHVNTCRGCLMRRCKAIASDETPGARLVHKMYPGLDPHDEGKTLCHACLCYSISRGAWGECALKARLTWCRVGFWSTESTRLIWDRMSGRLLQVVMCSACGGLLLDTNWATLGSCYRQIVDTSQTYL
jgi:hypothetical protein